MIVFILSWIMAGAFAAIIQLSLMVRKYRQLLVGDLMVALVIIVAGYVGILIVLLILLTDWLFEQGAWDRPIWKSNKEKESEK